MLGGLGMMVIGEGALSRFLGNLIGGLMERHLELMGNFGNSGVWLTVYNYFVLAK